MIIFDYHTISMQSNLSLFEKITLHTRELSSIIHLTQISIRDLLYLLCFKLLRSVSFMRVLSNYLLQLVAFGWGLQCFEAVVWILFCSSCLTLNDLHRPKLLCSELLAISAVVWILFCSASNFIFGPDLIFFSMNNLRGLNFILEKYFGWIIALT